MTVQAPNADLTYDQMFYLYDFANVVRKNSKDHKFDFVSQEVTIGEKKYTIPEYIEVFNVQAGFHKPRDMWQDIQNFPEPINLDKEFKREIFIKMSILVTIALITTIIVVGMMITIKYYGVI